MRTLIIAAIVFALLVCPSMAYDICGDRTCGDTESSLSCMQDCPSGGADLYCDAKRDGVCDIDCFEDDPDCRQRISQYDIQVASSPIPVSGDTFGNALLFLGLLVMLAILVIIILRKVKGNQQPPQRPMQQYSPPVQQYPQYPEQNPPWRPPR
jgi:hypothetical protein